MVDTHYGGCLGIILYDENLDLDEYVEGEPNSLFITFIDGKIILNTGEDDDGYYEEIDFG